MLHFTNTKKLEVPETNPPVERNPKCENIPFTHTYIFFKITL